MSPSRSPFVWMLAAVALVASASSAYAIAAGPSATSAPRRVVVRTVRNDTLNRKILVTMKGSTLYTLSAEVHGRFICKDASCLSLWTPLDVPRGTIPAGASQLGTVKRPDGHIEVTYRGRPLYTFNRDRKPGDIKGNGFKDVGTWQVASVGSSNARPASPGRGGYGS